MKTESVEINEGLIFDGRLFVTYHARAQYIGTVTARRPQWLKDNPNKWISLRDIQEQGGQLGPAVESETNVGAAPAGPNNQPSSRDVRKDDDKEDGVALVDTSGGDRSPPCEPISLPTPVKADFANGSTKAELLPPAKAAMSEAEEPKTETTPVGAMGHKRGRSGGRQLKTQKLSAGISEAGRKLSPATMRLILDSLTEYSILSHAAEKAGIHRHTLKYWLKHSAAGEDGYDVEWRGETAKFHQHFEAAMHEADEKVVGALTERAMGYDKIVTYRGRVIYEMDEFLLDLGYQGRDAYLRDKNGNPVPQTIRKAGTKAALWVLERLRPEVWGKNRKIDVPHPGGGVLVVGDVTKQLENSSAASIKARKWKSGLRMIQKAKT
jgi:hypothetical protein